MITGHLLISSIDNIDGAGLGGTWLIYISWQIVRCAMHLKRHVPCILFLKWSTTSGQLLGALSILSESKDIPFLSPLIISRGYLGYSSRNHNRVNF